MRFMSPLRSDIVGISIKISLLSVCQTFPESLNVVLLHSKIMGCGHCWMSNICVTIIIILCPVVTVRLLIMLHAYQQGKPLCFISPGVTVAT